MRTETETNKGSNISVRETGDVVYQAERHREQLTRHFQVVFTQHQRKDLQTVLRLQHGPILGPQ